MRRLIKSTHSELLLCRIIFCSSFIRSPGASTVTTLETPSRRIKKPFMCSALWYSALQYTQLQQRRAVRYSAAYTVLATPEKLPTENGPRLSMDYGWTTVYGARRTGYNVEKGSHDSRYTPHSHDATDEEIDRTGPSAHPLTPYLLY